MKTLVRLLAAGALAAMAPLASAEFHTFKIDRLYSNADGTVQYVVLRESAGFGWGSDGTEVSTRAKLNAVVRSPLIDRRQAVRLGTSAPKRARMRPTSCPSGSSSASVGSAPSRRRQSNPDGGMEPP